MNSKLRIADFERLQHDAALYGYEVSSNVAYDGTCFFATTSHAIGRSKEENSSL